MVLCILTSSQTDQIGSRPHHGELIDWRWYYLTDVRRWQNALRQKTPLLVSGRFGHAQQEAPVSGAPDSMADPWQ